MKLAQIILERGYKIVRPPRRFTQNQVDQEGLWIVCVATISVVLSVVLAVTFSMWACLSTPTLEIAEDSALALEIEDSEDLLYSHSRIVGCLIAAAAGCAFGCVIDSNRPLPRAVLLLL